MSENYKVIDSSTPTFITCTLIDWVDLFIRQVYIDVLNESLNYCVKNKGLKIHAFVYMSSHIHLVVSSNGEELQNIVRDFKKFTSRKLIEKIKEIPESRRGWLLLKFNYAAKRGDRATNFKVWQDGFHPVILDSGFKIQQRVRYTHQNPVQSGYVFHERDWVNSSYRCYEETDYFHDVKVKRLY